MTQMRRKKYITELSQRSYLYTSGVSGWQIRSAYSLGCISQVLRLGKRPRVCLYNHLENNVHVSCQFMKNECSSLIVMFLDGAPMRSQWALQQLSHGCK